MSAPRTVGADASRARKSLPILILAPLRNDAKLTESFLVTAGLTAIACPSVQDFRERAHAGCGALLLAEEALDREAAAAVGELLAGQPSWSELPVAIIISSGEPSLERRHRLASLGPSGNVTLIERPFRPGTLVSILKAALRSRQRQFQVRDLLEQTHRDAEVLRTSEERYRVLVASGNVWVWRMNAEGAADSLPTQWIAFTGQSEEGARGDGWSAAIHPEDRALSLPLWEKCVAERRIFETEYRVRRYDGVYRWFATRGVPIFAPDGTLREWVGTIADIHDRRSAEERYRVLAEETARQARIYEATLSSAIDLLYVFDLEGRFLYTNSRLPDLLGLTVEEVLGKNFHDLQYPAELAEKLAAQIQQVIQSGQPLRDETLFTSVSGTGAFEYIFAPVFGADGTVEAVAGSTRDITERQQVQQALEEQARALRDTDRRKDEFLAMLAHELRNPLSSIGNAVSLLKEDRSPENLSWSADVIARQSGQLGRLVDDLLDVSRITRGKIELRKRLLDAADCLESACEAVAPLLSERSHTLLATIPRGELWLEADPTRLEQIVVNLLANAAKYTEPHGRIRLTARSAAGEIIIELRDSGIGIPPAKIPSMFELFAQGERTIARSEGGLGIGLTVVRGLCEMHGGSIQAYSAGLGTGSTFTVRLPASAPPVPVAVPAREAAPPVAGVRVLVVDDNIDTAIGLGRLLNRRGHLVQLAHDGPAALAAARAAAPQVVLLDIGLPGMTGYEVARHLRHEPRCAGTLIVALSGYGQEEDRRLSHDAGFDHHLVKPVDFAEVSALIAAHGPGAAV